MIYSLDVICHNSKISKKNVLRPDLLVRSLTLELPSKKSRKIYTENLSSEKAAKRGSRIKSGAKTTLLRPSSLKQKTSPALTLLANKILPVEDNCHDPTTVDSQPIPIPSENLNIVNDDVRPKHDGVPFRKCLDPLPVVASGAKTKKFYKSGSAKRLLSNSNGSSDNLIDNRIEMELSQSSSESNVNTDANKHIVADVVINAKVEESKSVKSELHRKMKLEALANKRQQRQHQVNLSTMSTGTCMLN